MKTFLLSILAALALAGVGAVAKAEIVQIRGVLTEQVVPGRPNYESIATGDEPEKAWIVTTTDGSQPLCYQLVVAEDNKVTFAALSRSRGTAVVITGKTWGAETGHHHTDYLVTVHSAEAIPTH